MKLKKTNFELLAEGIGDFFAVQEYKDILRFAVQDVDLSDDVSADRARVDLVHAPYMTEPLSRCFIQPGVRKEVVISWPEQMGKSLVQLITLLHSISYNELQAIVLYPSETLAVQTSTVKFIPLLRKLPQFTEELNLPFAIRADRLKLSNALVYWQGAGSKVVSKSAKLVIADEAAIYQTPHGINNLAEMKKRTRSYAECLQLFISTPRYKTDPFWREFLSGSQAFYFLRCQHCGKLTMNSNCINNLQFQTVYNDELRQYITVRGTERLVCPVCRHEHTEEDRTALIQQGAYVHTFPEREKEFPTYQAGVLASLLNVHNWGTIADIQLSAGKSATLEDYISFDNSLRGLPYQEREYRKQDESALKRHYYAPSDLHPEEIEAVFMAADTQQTFSPCAVFTLTRKNNVYVLAIKRPRFMWLDDEERAVINAENKRNGKPPEQTLQDLLDREYFGLKPLALLVDMRGHRSDEVKAFARMRKNVLLYGGTSLKFQKWKVSDNNRKLFLCDAKKFQAELIFNLYFQQNTETNFLFLPETIDEKDLEEITSFQPDSEKRNGNLYQNWTPKDKVHDIFDVLKMGLAVIQISARIFRKERFRYGEAKILNPSGVKKPSGHVDDKPKQKVIRKSLFNRS